jgi:Fe-S-cluster containining protein
MAMKPRIGECGECQGCCTVLPFVYADGTKKPANQRCEHLTAHGCGIYQERPTMCREYECLWSLGVLEKDEERPDRIGLLLHREVRVAHPMAAMAVDMPFVLAEASARSRADRAVERWAKAGLVVIRGTEDTGTIQGPTRNAEETVAEQMDQYLSEVDFTDVMPCPNSRR